MNVSCSLRTKGSLKIVFFNGSDVEGELDKVEIILPGIVRCCHRCKLQPGKGVWEARPHVFDESKLLEASLFSDKTMKVFTPRRLWTDFIFDLPFFTYTYTHTHTPLQFSTWAKKGDQINFKQNVDIKETIFSYRWKNLKVH